MSATLTLSQNENELTEVRLHGELARRFGKVFHLAVGSPAEACKALRHQLRGWVDTIRELDRRGLVFRVRSKDHDYDSTDLEMTLGRNRRIDIIPIVRGASAGVRFVVGIVLVAVGLYTGNTELTRMGVALMLSSVAEWLTPVPKRDVTERKESWTLSGAESSSQGEVVPVVYGEVITGGVPISAGMSVSQVGNNGEIGHSVTIGGNFDPNFSGRGNSGPFTAKLYYSAAVFNLSEPFTYSWTFTGFTGATVSMSQQTTATLQLTLSATVPIGESAQYEGDIEITASGWFTNSDGDKVQKDVTAKATVVVSYTNHESNGGS